MEDVFHHLELCLSKISAIELHDIHNEQFATEGLAKQAALDLRAAVNAFGGVIRRWDAYDEAKELLDRKFSVPDGKGGLTLDLSTHNHIGNLLAQPAVDAASQFRQVNNQVDELENKVQLMCDVSGSRKRLTDRFRLSENFPQKQRQLHVLRLRGFRQHAMSRFRDWLYHLSRIRLAQNSALVAYLGKASTTEGCILRVIETVQCSAACVLSNLADERLAFSYYARWKSHSAAQRQTHLHRCKKVVSLLRNTELLSRSFSFSCWSSFVQTTKQLRVERRLKSLLSRANWWKAIHKVIDQIHRQKVTRYIETFFQIFITVNRRKTQEISTIRRQLAQTESFSVLQQTEKQTLVHTLRRQITPLNHLLLEANKRLRRFQALHSFFVLWMTRASQRVRDARATDSQFKLLFLNVELNESARRNLLIEERLDCLISCMNEKMMIERQEASQQLDREVAKRTNERISWERNLHLLEEEQHRSLETVNCKYLELASSYENCEESLSLSLRRESDLKCNVATLNQQLASIKESLSEAQLHIDCLTSRCTKLNSAKTATVKYLRNASVSLWCTLTTSDLRNRFHRWRLYASQRVYEEGARLLREQAHAERTALEAATQQFQAHKQRFHGERIELQRAADQHKSRLSACVALHQEELGSLRLDNEQLHATLETVSASALRSICALTFRHWLSFSGHKCRERELLGECESLTNVQIVNQLWQDAERWAFEVQQHEEKDFKCIVLAALHSVRILCFVQRQREVELRDALRMSESQMCEVVGESQAEEYEWKGIASAAQSKCSELANTLTEFSNEISVWQDAIERHIESWKATIENELEAAAKTISSLRSANSTLEQLNVEQRNTTLRVSQSLHEKHNAEKKNMRARSVILILNSHQTKMALHVFYKWLRLTHKSQASRVAASHHSARSKLHEQLVHLAAQLDDERESLNSEINHMRIRLAKAMEEYSNLQRSNDQAVQSLKQQALNGEHAKQLSSWEEQCNNLHLMYESSLHEVRDRLSTLHHDYKRVVLEILKARLCHSKLKKMSQSTVVIITQVFVATRCLLLWRQWVKDRRNAAAVDELRAVAVDNKRLSNELQQCLAAVDKATLTSLIAKKSLHQAEEENNQMKLVVQHLKSTLQEARDNQVQQSAAFVTVKESLALQERRLNSTIRLFDRTLLKQQTMCCVRIALLQWCNLARSRQSTRKIALLSHEVSSLEQKLRLSREKIDGMLVDLETYLMHRRLSEQQIRSLATDLLTATGRATLHRWLCYHFKRKYHVELRHSHAEKLHNRDALETAQRELEEARRELENLARLHALEVSTRQDAHEKEVHFLNTNVFATLSNLLEAHKTVMLSSSLQVVSDTTKLQGHTMIRLHEITHWYCEVARSMHHSLVEVLEGLFIALASNLLSGSQSNLLVRSERRQLKSELRKCQRNAVSTLLIAKYYHKLCAYRAISAERIVHSRIGMEKQIDATISLFNRFGDAERGILLSHETSQRRLIASSEVQFWPLIREIRCERERRIAAETELHDHHVQLVAQRGELAQTELVKRELHAQRRINDTLSEAIKKFSHHETKQQRDEQQQSQHHATESHQQRGSVGRGTNSSDVSSGRTQTALAVILESSANNRTRLTFNYRWMSWVLLRRIVRQLDAAQTVGQHRLEAAELCSDILHWCQRLKAAKERCGLQSQTVHVLQVQVNSAVGESHGSTTRQHLD